MNEDGSEKETEVRSTEATKVWDVYDVVRQVLPVDALVSDEVVWNAWTM
jgi:hypothetical protein